MTNCEMMEIAMRQSAEDMGCHVEDFKADKNVVVPINLGKKARKYLKEPITCNLVSYGNNIMAASIPETMDLVSAYVDKFEFYHCFETPNMHWLNERLAEKGHKICFMAEYYLPDISRIPTLSCAYVTRVLTQEAFADLYRPNGAMRFAKIGRIWMYLASAHMMEARWWDLPPVLPIATICGRLVWMSCRNTDDRGLPLH